MAKEARYYEKLNNKKVNCRLCPHRCKIKENQTGICRVRENKEGTLYTQNYGRVSSIAMDPLEKKPLYHFYPGKYILSVGSLGCNFSCQFCQNYQIAQETSPTQEISPRYLLNLCRSEEDCIGIAYTYNEPGIWFEYVAETAEIFHREGLQNVLVSNGYLAEEPLKELLQVVDAMNIDLKGFQEDFYSKICGGSLKEVQRTIELAASKAHVEVTTLIIPGHNDSPEEMKSLSSWLAGIDPSIPLHLSRYYPQYKMSAPPTPVETLFKLREVAAAYLDYVYVDNVSGADNSTYCPQCGALLLQRGGEIVIEHLDTDEGQCTKCGREIPVIGL